MVDDFHQLFLSESNVMKNFLDILTKTKLHEECSEAHGKQIRQHRSQHDHQKEQSTGKEDAASHDLVKSH